MLQSKGARAPSTRGVLVIGRGVTIVGSLSLTGPVIIEGSVDGEVRCSELQIAERGSVDGLIVAGRVVVLGEVVGSIYAGELVLGAACAVEGQIFHKKLVLEEGCYFEGQSRRSSDPVKLAPVRPPPIRSGRGPRSLGFEDRVA